MDSVIIDEGFGSLDQAGLREMSEELHRLSDTLGRIILVSHQEEFARTFPHKYEIKLADGSSLATLLDCSRGPSALGSPQSKRSVQTDLALLHRLNLVDSTGRGRAVVHRFRR